MRRKRGRTLFRRWFGRSRMRPTSDSAPSKVLKGKRLTGAELEKAYRDLLLEHQVLAESNTRLHERITRLEASRGESPAEKELIGAQRDALVERSRRLRELEFDRKTQARDRKKLEEENRQLNELVARCKKDLLTLQRRDENSRKEIAEARAALWRKNDELIALKKRQEELLVHAQCDEFPPSSAA